jgi:hypothetical protein
MAVVNSVPMPAMPSRRWCAMGKEEALINYTTAMILFKKLLSNGVINEDEFHQIDEALTQKYGLSTQSIYR